MEKIKNKLLFVFLAFFYIVFLFSISRFILFLATPKLSGIHTGLASAFNYLADIAFLFIAIKLLFIVISSLFEKKILFFPKTEHKFIYVLARWVIPFGSFFKIGKDRILNSFFIFNNSLAFCWKMDKNKKSLLLLPRCLQYSGCQQKVTENIKNCKQCKKCNISELSQIKDQYNFEVYVATGGELAKKILLELKPAFIIAVACENELFINSKDIPPYPIVVISNKRPNGPCKDTLVDVEQVKKYISFFTSLKN